jgi:hypothetical protein
VALPVKALKASGALELAHLGAFEPNRTGKLLFRRCVPTVRQGRSSAVLAGQVGG